MLTQPPTRRAFQMRVVTMGGGSGEGGEEGSESSGSESEGEGAPAGATFEQQVAAAQARKKAEAAKEFVRVRGAMIWACALCAGEGGWLSDDVEVHDGLGHVRFVASVHACWRHAAVLVCRFCGGYQSHLRLAIEAVGPCARPDWTVRADRAMRILAPASVQVYNLQKASGMGMAVDPKVGRGTSLGAARSWIHAPIASWHAGAAVRVAVPAACNAQ